MKLEYRIRLIAGSFILMSLALAHWVNPHWLWFTAFIGANLIQSSLTKWCLMEDILKKVGLAGPTEAGPTTTDKRSTVACGDTRAPIAG